MPVRYGGEEFALIVPGPADEALEAAERVRAAVARVRVMAPGGEAVGTTISAGVADFRNGADDLDGDLMLRQADTALYRSKAAGRDRVSLHASERPLGRRLVGRPAAPATRPRRPAGRGCP